MRTSWLHFPTAHFSLNNHINKNSHRWSLLDIHIIYAVLNFFQQAVIQKRSSNGNGNTAASSKKKKSTSHDN